MPLPRRISTLINALKQRGVFQVVVAYVAASLVALEALDIVVPAVGLPEWTVTAAVYGLIAGLPGVALLAWIYDVTPFGVIKTGTRSRDSSLLGGPGPTPDPHSIAVLPFVNLTDDPELAYFCDGMTEEVINFLVRVPGAKVAARTSSFSFKDRNVDIREVGKQLGVALVLEGSVRQHGPLIRITVQLSKAADGYHLWSERYEERLEDVFSLQDNIADAVTRTITPQLADAEDPPSVPRGTDHPNAYHAFLKGRHAWYARALPKAAEHFGRAISLDADYALAYAGLADACTYLGFYGFIPSRDAAERAQAAALRAVATQPDLADAHYSLGLVEFLFGWDLDAAQREFESAASSNPGLAMPHAQLCQLHAARRDVERADEAAARAIDLEPLAPLVHATVGFANVFLQQYERAIEACRAALEIDPEALPAIWVMATALIQAGRHEEAIPMLEGAVAATQRNNFMLMWLGGGYVLAGREDDARAVLAELESRVAAGAPVLPSSRAWIHAHLGETEAAFALLEEAVAQRNTQVSFFIFFRVPGIHDDPRFAQLVADTGLSEILDGLRTEMS